MIRFILLLKILLPEKLNKAGILKTIVILSTEPWGKMFLSKMHYAIELARQGNNVYFINPPRKIKSKGIAALDFENKIPNLTIINTGIFIGDLFIRYKLFFLYKKISALYVRAIKKIVNNKIDEVWCFNPHVYVDLKNFKANKVVIFLYDFYKSKNIFKTGETADGIISISQLILDYYSSIKKPKLLLQHGLRKHFSELAYEKIGMGNFKTQENTKVKIGYVGNMLRVGIDLDVARNIISEHRDKEFHFWGPYSLQDNNLSPVAHNLPDDLKLFIIFLQNQSHVVLHGVTEQQPLANQLFKMDLFLFLYSNTKDINGASNSHKIIEYLSTGKAVVSTYVSNYSATDLLVMANHNQENQLPDLFSQVTKNLEFYNSKQKQQQRMEFALNNTYSNQINRINDFIYN